MQAVFFKAKWSLNFSNGFSKHSRNLLYYLHQNMLKPCIATISLFR